MARLASGSAATVRGAPDVGESVAAHLRALLNTRKGDAVTAPRLGMVDFNELVHDFPRSLTALQQAIRATLLEYEPRLAQVSVKHVANEDPLVLRFDITAQLVEGAQGRSGKSLRFRTEVKPGGQIEVA